MTQPGPLRQSDNLIPGEVVVIIPQSCRSCRNSMKSSGSFPQPRRNPQALVASQLCPWLQFFLSNTTFCFLP